VADQNSQTNENIAAILVQKSEGYVRAKRSHVEFSKNSDADALLNDLENYPHAFVLACIMDRQMKAERAWLIPYLVGQAVGGFSFERLQAVSARDIRKVFMEQRLHRFPELMSRNFHAAIGHIRNSYGGDAGRIWRDSPSSAKVVFRFLQFKGVGTKIATMATNILARRFTIPFADYYSVDVSADVHVRRVFRRLGLVS